MTGRSTLAASLALAGGIAAGVGSFLPWAEISAGPFSERASGVSGWEGKATLIAALVLAAAAIRVFTGGSEAVAGLRVRAAIGGLVAAGVGTYTALTAREQLLNAAEGQLPRSVVQAALDSGELVLSLSDGLFIVIAAGALGLLAATVATGTSRRVSRGSGAGLSGWSAPAPTAPLPPGRIGVPPPPSPWAVPPPAGTAQDPPS